MQTTKNKHRKILELIQALRGKRHERNDPDQLLLFDIGELEQIIEEQLAEEPNENAGKKPRRKRGHGRRLIPDNLPHEEVLIELEEHERLCPVDGIPMPLIRYETSKQLDYEPPQLKVIVTKRAVYACPRKHDEAKLVTAPKPPQVIDKGLFSCSRTVSRDGHRQVACWAHCRRYWHKARDQDASRAHHVLAIISRLYEVERAAKDADAETRRLLRAEHAAPLLTDLETWLEDQSFLPKSLIGQAATYTRNQWQALNRYVEDGDLSIDNNAAERAMKPVAIGRKNWLFIGSKLAGQRASVLMTLMASCKRNQVEPFAWLRSILVGLATGAELEVSCRKCGCSPILITAGPSPTVESTSETSKQPCSRPRAYAFVDW